MVTDLSGTEQTQFSDRVRSRARDVESWLCIGLDPDIGTLPTHLSADARGISTFCQEIVRATHTHAAAFKINFAFFEQFGAEGFDALSQVRDSIPAEIPVIADAKRGDIANTARAYARALFDTFKFDAATISPYLGWDTLEPFMEYRKNGLIVLCKTSNPGSGALQDLPVGDGPLYLHVARRVVELSSQADVGLVVGATHPDSLTRVRSLSSDVLLLVPGVGAQGADIRSTMSLAANRHGENALIAVSRGVAGGSVERNYAQSAARAAERLASMTWQRLPS